MTDKKDEALKLAQVAQRVLKAWDHPHGMPALCQEMNALREALAEQPAQQGCMRCNTPNKCALHGCSPLTWPAEQPAPPPECKTDAEKTAFAFGWWKALEENRKQPAQGETK